MCSSDIPYDRFFLDWSHIVLTCILFPKGVLHIHHGLPVQDIRYQNVWQWVGHKTPWKFEEHQWYKKNLPYAMVIFNIQNGPKLSQVCSFGIQERVWNNRGKRAISVRATEFLLYYVCCKRSKKLTKQKSYGGLHRKISFPTVFQGLIDNRAFYNYLNLL